MLATPYGMCYKREWKYKLSLGGPPSLKREAKERSKGGLRGPALGSQCVPVFPRHSEVLGTEFSVLERNWEVNSTKRIVCIEARDLSFVLGSSEGLKFSSWLGKGALETSLWETIESLKAAGSVFSDTGEQPLSHRQPARLFLLHSRSR